VETLGGPGATEPARSLVVMRFILLAACGLLLFPEARAEEPVRLIAFGSCFRPTSPAPIFDAVVASKPDVFLWMGDNIYGDTEDMEELRAKYQVAKELPAYVTLRESCRIFGTWDDHDYGVNDGGAEYPMRRESQKVLLDFLDEPADSPRRSQEGVYQRVDLGPQDQRVRIVLLDTRYHRDPIGSDGTILGEEQWKWLEDQLVGSAAAMHVIVSSIQVLPKDHPHEKWANFPRERARLLALLARADVPPVIILSGDRHLGEISVDAESCSYPLVDVTSSSLNRAGGGREDEVNSLRQGANLRTVNFGTLAIDWDQPVPTVTAALRNVEGVAEREISVAFKR
jgi:alkaline phosphatase D